MRNSGSTPYLRDSKGGGAHKGIVFLTVFFSDSLFLSLRSASLLPHHHAATTAVSFHHTLYKSRHASSRSSGTCTPPPSPPTPLRHRWRSFK
ncbi:unnamed protein product [Ectocarpus sp. 4 AP-2014]|uniref:EsV-1-10 n=1 Tax=Ectocarpus siliculosus virus 1 (isolate New Zealand/Kaikoura/1988) TaxID=654926 RepID=Q8QNP9_ESV1K|nr:EsV-1-10 [Ectocarpus siliculosus virus 1]AAK14436.1 EsV-1-10 [Ectocarpus siliculosus virus 1]